MCECKNSFFLSICSVYYIHYLVFISLHYIIPCVPMCGCLGRHSCVSSLFIIAIPNYISQSYIIPGVPMHSCLGRHSCVRVDDLSVFKY